LVYGNIKNSLEQESMFTNLKEMQMFCEKVFAEYTEEKWYICCCHMKMEEE
jgi:hypothetical protein